MSPKASPGFVGAIATAGLLIGALPASSHTIVGNRVFPATLTIDDPGVNDELALPTFSFLTAANPDGTPGPTSYTLGWEYAKTITADLGLSIGSEGVTFQRNPRATGVANIETQLKYVFHQDSEREFIVAGALNLEIGHTGSPPDADLPADPFSTLTPKLYIGKGFGDVAADWARPFALTAEVDYSIPTVTTNADMSTNPNVLTYGATLQYSLLYRNAFVSEVPPFLNKLIPAVEVILNTPLANTGPSTPGVPVHITTGVAGPSLYYIGQYFEVGVMAQVPVNQASGKHVGVLAVVDFFLDDIAPTTFGKPLFGPAQSRATSY